VKSVLRGMSGLRKKNYDLWVTGFCGSYAGYISPDKYYGEIINKKGSLAYETGLMSWCGPDQEAYFTDLMKHMVESIRPFPDIPKQPREVTSPL